MLATEPCSIGGSTHTPPVTWVTTLPKALARPVLHPHEESNLHEVVASWSADMIGPTIIAAPHCGHLQVARGVSAVAAGGVSFAVGAGAAGTVSTVRARATRVVRHALARNPDCRMRTNPRGKMCWTKRRRNSMAVSVITRR